MKILLAVDGSSCSDAAVAEVGRIPWPTGSEVRIISAAEMPFFPATEFGTLPQQYFEELEVAARKRAKGIVEKAVENLTKAPAAKLTVTSEVIFEGPREAIVDEAERWNADWIVVGSHGYRGYKRFLLGSVSQAVAAHAPCSVLIVRSPQ